jgi:hypothetical protein
VPPVWPAFGWAAFPVSLVVTMNYHLISQFEQFGTMTGLQNAALTAGACHNFSIHWCALMFTVPFQLANDRMGMLGAGKGAGSPALTKAFHDAWNEPSRDLRGADHLSVSTRGLERRDYVIPWGAFDQAAVNAVVAAPRYPAMVYTFSLPNATPGAAEGSHTIAFFRELQPLGPRVPVRDQVSSFDPNYGEYLIPATDFANWFNQLKQHYGGTFTGHQMFYCEPSGRKPL